MTPAFDRPMRLGTAARHAGARGPSAGFTMLEAVVCIAILSIIMAGALAYLASAWASVQYSRERIFATQKAISILNEVRGFIETEQGQKFARLDDLDDGINTSPYLTIATVSSPDHEASGNVTQQDGQWKFSRHITVRPLPNVSARDIRLIMVEVYGRNQQGSNVLLADVASVVRTVSDSFPTTQVYDVYALAVENVPGWWVYMSRIRPFMEATITDLENRNPGLKFRLHWITRHSYGRDPEYLPYLNDDELDSVQPVDYVYFYPGKMPTGQSSDYYYVPNITNGRFWLGDTVGHAPTLMNDYAKTNDPLTNNRHPYSLADTYNHAMRYPDELLYFQARRDEKLSDDATSAPREFDTAPTWRLILDDLISNPTKYTHVIIANLHGELLPIPPVRNYSDPAKDPANKPNWRVVTHPENIWYYRSPSSLTCTESPRLRVYAFRTDPDATGALWKMDVPIWVQIDGVDLTGGSALSVQRIAGGLDTNGDGTADEAYVAPAEAPRDGRDSHTADEMYYTLATDTNPDGTVRTKMKLYNTPLRCAQVGSGASSTGLKSTLRLYGYEYIPCSCESANNFTTTLATTGEVEKNTARWIITISKDSLGGAISNTDQVLAVTTKIGDEDGNPVIPDTNPARSYVSGTMYPPDERYKPQNTSRTYVYWSASSDYVPFTERYQFIGDPRHCPYADLKNNGVTYSREGVNTTKSFTNGYNWYFDNFRSSSGDDMSRWPGFSDTRIKNNQGNNADGWDSDMNEVDTPRFLQLLRTGLTQSDAVFTTLTGYCFYYMCLGADIGYDSANGYANGVPVSAKPYTGGSGSGYEQWMTDDAGGTWGYGVKYIRENASGSGYWWGRNWIGELFPDSAYTSQWAVSGNLATGVGSGYFIRTLRSNISSTYLPRGTSFRAARRRTNQEGSTSYFNIELESGKHYHHQYCDGQSGTLTTAGQDMAQTYFFPLPTSTKISRPFNLKLTGGTGDHWSFTTDYPRTKAQTISQFYVHQNGNMGSSLLAHQTSDLTKASFIVVNGIDRTTETGSAFIAKYTMLSLVHGYLTAGLYTGSGRVHELPRIKIKEPTSLTQIDDPLLIPVRWGIQWRRWDGQLYTSGYAAGFSEADEPDLLYTLCYSPDNGTTWKFMKEDGVIRLAVDNAVCGTSGTVPRNADGTINYDAVRTDLVVNGDEEFDWDVSTLNNDGTLMFPEGSYLIRLEVFRRTMDKHYAYHIEKIYIDR